MTGYHTSRLHSFRRMATAVHKPGNCFSPFLCLFHLDEWMTAVQRILYSVGAFALSSSMAWLHEKSQLGQVSLSEKEIQAGHSF